VKVATLDLSPDMLMSFMQASKSGPPRYFMVKKNPLPDDARIVHVAPCTEHYPIVWRLFIESDSFEEVEEGCVPPALPLVVYETVHAEITSMVP
jgi:hypothetical protein